MPSPTETAFHVLRVIGAGAKNRRNSNVILKLLITLLLLSAPTFAANHFVTPTGAGAKNGADWNNAYAGLPGSLTRGDAYYLAKGSYSSHNFSDSGTAVITISACTASMTACTGTAGWTTGYAVDCTSNNQVVFAAPLTFSSDYYILTGACRASDMTGEGMKINNKWPNSTAFPLNLTGRSNITVRYVELQGAGIHLNSGETTSIASASCSSNVVTITSGAPGVSWHYPYVGKPINVSGVAGGSGFNTGAAPAYVTIASVTDATHFTYNSTCSGSGTGGTITGPWGQQEEQVRTINGGSNLYIGYSYFHDSSMQIVEESGSTNLTFEQNLVGPNSSNAVYHGECFGSQSGDANITARYNVFQDCEGTSTFVIVEAGGAATATNWQIYGNVILTSNGNPRHQNPTGWGMFMSQQPVNGVYVYNNTVINNLGSTNLFAWQYIAGTCSNVAVENNLVYVSGAAFYSTADTNSCTSIVRDHNSFLNTTPPSALGTGDVSDQSAPNPFTAWTTGNYTLASENSDWRGGITLPSPYNTDPTGNTRGADGTWERGAFEYDSAVTVQPPASPQNLQIVSVQ